MAVRAGEAGQFTNTRASELEIRTLKTKVATCTQRRQKRRWNIGARARSLGRISRHATVLGHFAAECSDLLELHEEARLAATQAALWSIWMEQRKEKYEHAERYREMIEEGWLSDTSWD